MRNFGICDYEILWVILNKLETYQNPNKALTLSLFCTICRGYVINVEIPLLVPPILKYSTDPKFYKKKTKQQHNFQVNLL